MSELTKPITCLGDIFLITRKWVEQCGLSRDCTCSRFTR